MTTTPADPGGSAPVWESDGGTESVSVMLVGDTGFGQSYVDRYGVSVTDLHEGPFEHLDGLLHSSDLVVANLETVFTDTRESPLEEKRPFLHYDDPVLGPQSLLKHNIRAVTHANNHVMDMGESGFLDTLTALEAHDISYVGAGRSLERAMAPLRLRLRFPGGAERGVSIFSGFRTSTEFNELTGSFATPDTPGCNPLTTSDLRNQITQLRQDSPGELIIVTPHWWRDYQWASDAQRSFARAVTRAGADLVVGHGSHMAQEIDIMNGRPVFHGIGNFLFNSNGRYSEHGVPPYSSAVRLHLTADDTQLRVYPLHTDNRATSFRSRPVSDDQFEEFYHTALAQSHNSASFLRAIGAGQDAQGRFLEIPLTKKHRARVNPHRRGTGSTLTYWEDEPEEITFDRRKSNNHYVLERALRTHGATVRRLDSGTIAGHSSSGRPYLLRTAVTHHTGTPGIRAVKKKDLARRILAEAGASVAAGGHFRSIDDFDEAVDLMRSVGPVVVKPVDGNIGRGVTVGVNDVEHLRAAWTHAFSETRSGVLLEQQFEGEEFRISVVDGIACAVTKRVPPQITGDGVRTVRDLINEQNDERHEHLVLHSKPLDLAGYRLRRLLDAGLTPLSVLPDGETYIIDHMGSVGSGAHPVHCIEDIDPSYLRSAERAARAFHDLDIVGIDMLCADTSEPARADNHIIIEVNSKPEISTHAAATSPRAPRSFPARIVESALADRPVGPFRRRDRRPEKPDSPTSARLLAAEFAARSMEITWWNDVYFHAQADGTAVSVWGATTDRTGGSGRSATLSTELSQALLRRARLPLAGNDTDGWQAAASHIRLLVAHGRVLAATDPADPDRRNVLRTLHTSYRAVAAAAVAAFTGVDLAEVSLLVRDPHGPAVKKETAVESVRTEPDLVEWAEAAGPRADIIRTIVDLHLGGEDPAPEPDVKWTPAAKAKAQSRESTPRSAIGDNARRIARAIKRRLT